MAIYVQSIVSVDYPNLLTFLLTVTLSDELLVQFSDMANVRLVTSIALGLH